MKILIISLLTLASTLAQALGNTYESFGDYKVHYSVFNSSFIQPEVAQAYKLIRGKDRAIVNIAVVKDDSLGGIPVQLSGKASNLLQQSKTLDFLEIREQDAVYYLAPLRFTNEETMNFTILVQVGPNGPSHTLTFTKTLYVDK